MGVEPGSRWRRREQNEEADALTKQDFSCDHPYCSSAVSRGDGKRCLAARHSSLRGLSATRNSQIRCRRNTGHPLKKDLWANDLKAPLIVSNLPRNIRSRISADSQESAICMSLNTIVNPPEKLNCPLHGRTLQRGPACRCAVTYDGEFIKLRGSDVEAVSRHARWHGHLGPGAPKTGTN